MEDLIINFLFVIAIFILYINTIRYIFTITLFGISLEDLIFNLTGENS